ncbi:MAG: cyanophycinase, partial [Planctomycetota bacterium]|nr:cyanophycinase [Planctomycetota bacterium]
MLTIAVLGIPGALDAQCEPSRDRIRAAGMDGSLVIVGGGQVPAAARERFLELAGGTAARLVVIPTASARADDGDPETWLAPWRNAAPASLQLLHARERRDADDPGFVAPLKEATGVWFAGGDPSRIARAYVGTRVEKVLAALLERGGVIGGTSGGAAVLSRVMIASGTERAVLGRGFDFLPGAVIDQHFSERQRKTRLRAVLESRRGLVGLGVDEGTAAIVRGRRLQVVGRSSVTLLLGPGELRPEGRETVLRAGAVADWTTLRRAAAARARPRFPPERPRPPEVTNGALVIVGGGMPDAALRRFIELAGGPDAPILVIPTAVPDPVPAVPRDALLLRRAGARRIEVLHGRTTEEVEAPRFLDALRRARGVWFGGGRQWRFVDAYAGTKACELFHDVLRRGGVIGGSSAGASIQADYLVRGHPLGNRRMMAEGYERGFGFLPGTAVDQHFAQRRRLPDMTRLMRAFPQLLGIGIDERTALVVEGHVGRVVGDHDVRFYDWRTPPSPGAPDHVVVGPGGRYDLLERR